jgi:hypothetical protein
MLKEYIKKNRGQIVVCRVIGDNVEVQNKNYITGDLINTRVHNIFEDFACNTEQFENYLVNKGYKILQ